MEEKEIVHIALDNLDPALLKGEWHPCTPNNRLDGQLTLIFENQKVRFDAIVKKELRTYQVEKIIDQAPQYHNPIVIAYTLYPALKEKLKEHRVNYLEANGNLFVRADNLFLFLDRYKKLNKPKMTGNRAFTPTGLKVVFGFLQDKKLINKPQRDIAKTTGVALGNIPKVIKGLQETGYLYKVNRKAYAFHNREELLHTWIGDTKTHYSQPSTKGRFV